MNIVLEQGRPTRDPELLKSERTGKVFCKIRMAVDRDYRGKEFPQQTDYFDMLIFGKLGQAAYNNVAKGALITILGTLQNTKRMDRTGNTWTENIIVVKKMTIHEWLRKHRPLEDLENDFDNDLLVPREITNSLFKQIDIAESDEDIPDDLAGRSIDDLFEI